MNETNFYQVCDRTPIEKVHTKFCRYILGVQRKSTNAAIRGELGQRPILTDLLSHSIKYWIEICHPNKHQSLVREAYLESYSSDLKWASSIKSILTLFKLENIWLNQGSCYKHQTIRLLKKHITNLYDSKWLEYMNRDDGKLRTYKEFKKSIHLENYLVAIKDINK